MRGLEIVWFQTAVIPCSARRLPHRGTSAAPSDWGEAASRRFKKEELFRSVSKRRDAASPSHVWFILISDLETPLLPVMADTAVGPPPNAGSKTRRPSQRLASGEKFGEPPK